MANDQPPSSQPESRVVKFRRGPAGTHSALTEAPPVADLAKFERGGEADDYGHRMMVNTAAFLFVLALIGAGIWLADTMAAMRRDQDCVLAGHRNCAPIEVTKNR